MSDYRRWYIPGGTWFFTVVTHDRIPIFDDPTAVRLLGAVMRTVRAKLPFRTIAVVVLPDHIHCVWSLPAGNSDFSGRWRWIKRAFTEQWLSNAGAAAPTSASRDRKRERGVWQRRFWEHQIRDEVDLERHLDYVHYNPVKHGYVARPVDWPWSSFARHVRLGQYPPDWGSTQPKLPAIAPPERNFA
jgi:putative transposase